MTQDETWTRSAIITIGLCLLATILEGMDIQAVGVAGPKIVAEFQLSRSTAGLLFSVGPLGLFFGAVIGGWASDRIGRKPTLIGSVAMFGALSVLTAMSWNTPSLVILRFLTGLGLGGAMPNLIALVSECSPARWKRALTTALWVGTPIGGMAVAQLARDLPDWRPIFFIGGVGPLLLTPLMMWLLPGGAPPATDHKGHAAKVFQILFGAGRVGPTLLLWTAFFCTLLLLHLLLNWLPLLIIGQGHAPSLAATAAVWFNFGGIVGTVLFALCLAFWAPRLLLGVVYAGMAISLFSLASVGALPQPVLVAAFAAGTFVIGGPFILYGMAPELYPAETRGAGVGAAIAAGRAGSVCGPAVVGLLLAQGLSPSTVLLGGIPLAVVAGLGALICFQRSPRPTTLP